MHGTVPPLPLIHLCMLPYQAHKNVPSAGWKWIFSHHDGTAPAGPGPPHYRGFAITLRHTTLGRSPLDEWSSRRRDLYLTVHNTQDSQETSISTAGFEPALPESERPQTHALDRAKTGISHKRHHHHHHRIYLRPKFVIHFSLASDVGSVYFAQLYDLRQQEMWSDFDRASSLICGNKMPTRCNRWYLLQAQHVSGNTMPIIRSSRVLYRWSLPVVFGALVFRLSVWCGAEGYVSGLQAGALLMCSAIWQRVYYLQTTFETEIALDLCVMQCTYNHSHNLKFILCTTLCWKRTIGMWRERGSGGGKCWRHVLQQNYYNPTTFGISYTFYSPHWHMRWAAINMSLHTGYSCRIIQLFHSADDHSNVFIITIETQEVHCDVMSWSIIGYEKCSQSAAHVNKCECYSCQQLSRHKVFRSILATVGVYFLL